ncbi:MAG: PEP-CTERM sorting domain-containing protein [Cyanobacteria bacterium J06632_3]
MNKLTIISITLGLSMIAPAARAAKLTFNFDAFIPAPRVVNPVADVLPPFFTEFTGDGRGFDFEATRNGESRLFTEVVLDTEAEDPLVSASTSGGISVGFLTVDGVEVSQSAQAIATSTVSATRLSDREILLQVAARTQNPLIVNFLPPEVPAEAVAPAEYIYDIALELSDDGVSYELTGTNRGFPSYSAFLNGTPILANPAGDEGSSLLEVLEPVSTSGFVEVSEATNVNEPATLLGLGIVAAAIARKRKHLTPFAE